MIARKSVVIGIATALGLAGAVAFASAETQTPPAPPPASDSAPPDGQGPGGHGMGSWMGEGMGFGHHGAKLSKEDRAAFFDARVAAIHAGLRLTAEQEKLWPPVESAVRDMAKTMSDLRDKAEAAGRPKDPIDGMQRMAQASIARGETLKKVADAAAPLYAALSPEAEGPPAATRPSWHAPADGRLDAQPWDALGLGPRPRTRRGLARKAIPTARGWDSHATNADLPAREWKGGPRARLFRFWRHICSKNARSCDFNILPGALRGSGSCENSDPHGRLEGGEMLADESAQFPLARLHARLQSYDRRRLFAEYPVRQADDGGIHDRRMAVQNLLDLDAVDVLAAADQHVLLAIDDVEEALLVDLREIAGLEPVVLEGFLRRLGLVPVTTHDIGPTHPQFADHVRRQRADADSSTIFMSQTGMHGPALSGRLR